MQSLTDLRTYRVKVISIILFIFTCIGFINAYIVYGKVYEGINAPCFIVQGCDQVLLSSYAQLGGVSLSIWGMTFYFVMSVLAASFIRYKKKSLVCLLRAGGVCGFLFSVYLVYIQAFLLHAFCSYCLISAIDSLVVFALTTILWFVYTKRQ